MEQLEESTGSKFRQVAKDLVSAGDARAVPVFVERMKTAQGSDRRLLMQAIGFMRHEDSIQPLIDILMGPDEAFGSSNAYRTMSYAAVMLTNIEESETPIDSSSYPFLCY